MYKIDFENRMNVIRNVFDDSSETEYVGSYEFDEYYFDDLKFTVKSINELIENDN